MIRRRAGEGERTGKFQQRKKSLRLQPFTIASVAFGVVRHAPNPQEIFTTGLMNLIR